MRAALALVRRAIRFELGLWKSLYRLVFRRPRATGPNAQAFTYADILKPVLIGFIVVSVIEIPIAHMLLPWKTAQIISIILGAQGLFWMIGLTASLIVYPHVLSDSGLRVRYGAGIDFTIPWDAIETIRTRIRSLPKSRTIQYDENGALVIAVSSQTNIDILLRYPINVPLPKGPSEPISELRCYADDPNALLRRARQNLTAEVN
ncbi:MAG TPA: hypothetical protein DGT23_07940 [Micromonosporaceae bacterium]|nr:hypothetical protein [Micromonosporaceae bacterium]